jgi:uncharacterized protein YggE
MKLGLLVTMFLFNSLAWAHSEAPTTNLQSQGSCVKSAVADKVEVSANVSTLHKKYDLAVQESQKTYNEVNKVLKALDDKLIVNSNMTVQEEYLWENNQQIFKGIRSSFQISVQTTPKLLNKVLNALTDKEIKINGVNFLLSDEVRQKLVHECLVEAAAQAKGYATKLAEGLGVELGPVQTSSFSFNQPHRPQPMYMKSMARGAEMVSDSQMGANELEVRVDTQVSFSILNKSN